MGIQYKSLKGWALICLTAIFSGIFINVDAYADEYTDAVKKAELNAEDTSRTWVADGLQTITGPGDGNSYVNVGGQNMVITRTFTKEKNTYYYSAGQDTTVYGSPKTDASWITLGEGLRNYWKQNNINYTNVQPETARVLGMNTNVTNNVMMEYLAVPDNENIQRPTKSPDITTYNKDTAALPTENFVRPPGISDQKYSDYITYYNNWKSQAYSKYPFPWTQYGYTYRWGFGDELDKIEGLSEFILLGGAPVRVYSIYTIQSYLYTKGNGSGDFNITDDLDTLWVGRKFQPMGDTVNISRNASISGGQGILVSSPGYTINNDGLISGSTKKKFNYNNTEDVAILFQGIIPTSPNVNPVPNNNNVLNNTGVISSPGIAIRADAGNTIITNNRGFIEGGLFAIKTGNGNDQVNMVNGLIKGSINLGAGNDNISVNAGAGFTAPSEIIFNLSTTIAPVQNVETINVNDNLQLSPVVSEFVPNNKKYALAENANVVIAPGKTISVTPVINMPMVTLNLDATNTLLISYRDLSWYTKNSYNSSLGQVLDNIAGADGGILADELYSLDTSDDPGGNSSQLEPVNQTGAYTSAFYSSLAFVDAFRDRLKRLRTDQNIAITANPNVTGFASTSQLYFDQKVGRIEAFANGYGYKQWFDATGNTPGYDTLAGGFISGVGGRFGKGSHAGILFGISNSDTDYKSRTANLGDTTYRVGPYASFLLGSINADALFTWGYHNAYTKRSIDFLDREAGANYSMNEFLGYFGLSKVFSLKRGFHITPHANIQYMFLNRAAYMESGADDVNLIVSRNRYNSLLVRPGISVMKDFKVGTLVIRPDLTVEYMRECLDPQKNIISSFAGISNSQFITTPGGIDFNSARIGAGISVFSIKSKCPVSVFVRNDTILGKRGVFNAITAGIRVAL